MEGGSAIGMTFQVTEEKGEAIYLRQAPDFLVEERLQVVPGDSRDEVFLSSFTGGLLVPAAEGCLRPCAGSRSAGDGVQPAPSDARLLIEPALRASVRKVAWKASSTSCSLPSSRRHTPKTIGP